MSRETRSILFYARNPHNVVVYERVLRRLLEDSRIRLYLSSKNKRTKTPNDLFERFDLPDASRIHHRWASWRAFDLYLSPDIYLLGRRARIKAHTFHGISIKGKSYTTKVLDYDRLFLIGPYQRRRFEKSDILKIDDARYASIGMPKTDALFDGLLDRKTFLERHRLNPDRPTLLYAPTWRPESSLHAMGEALIRSMRDAPWNLTIKLHDLSYTSDKIDWKARLRELKAPNIAVIEDLDATPALHAADLLISDASSVANEYTLLDRPLVFIDVPELFRKYADTVDLEQWGQQAGDVARDVKELHRLIEANLSDPGRHREMRRRIAREGFYNPGKATDAALDEIYRLLKLEKPRDRRATVQAVYS